MTAHTDDKPKGMFLGITPDLDVVSEPLNASIHKVTKKGENDIGWIMIHHSPNGCAWVPIPERMAKAWADAGAVVGTVLDIQDLAEMVRGNPTRH